MLKRSSSLRFIFCFSIVYCLLPIVNCFSQTNDSTYQYRSFRFNYDNDFFNATDYYYTQGIRLEIISPFIKKIPISKLLFHLRKSNDEQFGINFNQECFTPTSIRRDTVFTGDRPFAGTIFLGFQRVSNDEQNKKRITSEFDIGGVGPCASCEEEQKGIHKALNNIEPLGWQFQIANDIVLNYSVKYERQVVNNKYADLIASADAKIGTLYDNAGIDMTMRMGRMKNYFSLSKFSRHFYFYLFASQGVKFVAYNAAMEGGVFQKNNSYVIDPKNIERAVARASIGAVLSYKKMSVEYSKTFISPEFKNGDAHAWGHVCINFYF